MELLVRILNFTFLAAALFMASCGTETNPTKDQSEDQNLVRVSGAELPKTIILITNENTNNVKAYEVNAQVSFESMKDLSEAEKNSLTQGLKGKEISTEAKKSELSVNMEDFDLPSRNTINWYYGGYPGFYAYRYGYRFPYSYGFGFRYGGFRFAYYRPYYGYAYGYRNYYW